MAAVWLRSAGKSPTIWTSDDLCWTRIRTRLCGGNASLHGWDLARTAGPIARKPYFLLQVDGRLDDARVADVAGADGPRRPVGALGDIAAGKDLPAEFTLLVKHNALFAALLPELGRHAATP